ncbi:membrane protein insertion efficiency factor YidD [Bermanella sp. R86510]|uniref:membrane protein insertion efficiency factor YidD n=1 Tax=unclassified Bermanella TaxID=2627862 RepID=UPI0037C8A27E
MDTFEFNVDEKLRPSVERKLTGSTSIDREVSALSLDGIPISIKPVIAFLRLYRKVAPKALRCRCVFDPSCSHYSELAFREHGLITGTRLTFNRLHRCKPNTGGIDFLNLKQGK